MFKLSNTMNNKHKSEKYVLFCAQEANFQTRTMLIPYNKYIKTESATDFDILRNNSKSKEFVVNGKNYTIQNLLIQNIDLHGKNASQLENISQDCERIINRLTHLACGVGHFDYNSDSDDSNNSESWYDCSYINLSSGFDHIENFIKLSEMKHYNNTPIHISESFLVLQKFC